MTAPQPPPTECVVPLVEVRITDELDLARLPATGAVFDRLLSLRPEHVVVDLSGCRHLDAAAIGFLLEVHRHLARDRAVLTVRNPSLRIRRILQTTRLDQVLPVVATGGAESTGAPGAADPVAAAMNATATRAERTYGRATVPVRP